MPAQRHAHWPLGEDDPHGVKDDWEERTRRSWLRLPVLVAVLAIVAVLVAGGIALFNRDDLSVPGVGGGGDEPTATPSPVSGQALKVQRSSDLDPFAVPPSENPDEVGNAVDGDRTTAWQTVTYRGRPTWAVSSRASGCCSTSARSSGCPRSTCGWSGSPTGVTVYTARSAATTAPSGIEGLDRAAQRAAAPETLIMRFDQAVRTRFVVVWLTSLPKVSGGFRGGIAEVVVRS